MGGFLVLHCEKMLSLTFFTGQIITRILVQGAQAWQFMIPRKVLTARSTT